MHGRIIMKTLLNVMTLSLLFSCVEPDPKDHIKKGDAAGGLVSLNRSQTEKALANKNFLQINNTFSKLTGISPDQGNVLSEYQAIQLQLPSSTDPETLNGFNQIASTRLAFAYCDQYIEANQGNYDFSTADTNDAELKAMVLNFVDMDFDNNSEHQEFLTNLHAILSDEDELVNDGNFSREKRKLMKMSCAATLSSTYVTLL